MDYFRFFLSSMFKRFNSFSALITLIVLIFLAILIDISMEFYLLRRYHYKLQNVFKYDKSSTFSSSDFSSYFNLKLWKYNNIHVLEELNNISGLANSSYMYNNMQIKDYSLGVNQSEVINYGFSEVVLKTVLFFAAYADYRESSPLQLIRIIVATWDTSGIELSCQFWDYLNLTENNNFLHSDENWNNNASIITQNLRMSKFG